MNNEKIEESEGYKIAITFKPFIDPRCSEHLEIVKDMAKTINSAINRALRETEVKIRVKQLLSSLEYEKLTDFQAKLVLLLEQSIK